MATEHLAAFAPVRTWVFDLDNTLYPSGARLFDQIERLMTTYVMRALEVDLATADRLRADYWARYGTTLAGLMAEHGLDPVPYLDAVHRVDLSALTPDPDLAALIADLPGRRVVFTNADRAYAARVLQARGLSGVFDAVYGVEDAGYAPKPQAAAFARVFGAEGLDPTRAAMFEDDHRNLQVPHGLGLQTVLVAETRPDLAHVQHHAPDLGPFLARLLAALSGDGTGG